VGEMVCELLWDHVVCVCVGCFEGGVVVFDVGVDVLCWILVL